MNFSAADYVFECHSYIQFLNAALAGNSKSGIRKPRGAIIALAQRLNCHTSFISQVLSGRAHFSIDHGLLTAEHFQLGGSSRDHWLDLILKEKSGTQESMNYFTKRIEDRIQNRRNLAQRWQTDCSLNELESWQFFSSWLPQVAYSVLHLPKINTIERLAKALQISNSDADNIITLLEQLKLVSKKKDQYYTTNHWIHLPKESPVIRLHHQAWRQRSIEEFAKASELTGFHYSGAITVSKADAKQIHQELLTLMDSIRSKVNNSSSEESHGLILDFFKTIKD